MTKKTKDFLQKNKYILILFLTSTAYFIFQRAMTFSWDFNAYVLNASYLFGQGSYFEILRPPLMPIIIGLLSLLLGLFIAQYLYIILVSGLFCISSVYLAKQLKLNPLIFYGLGLNFFVLTFGLINGSELLAYTFLLLAFALLVKDNVWSGGALALSALARYSNLIFFPFLLLQRSLKKIFLSLILFGLALSPWLIYNFYKTGNFFTSIADQYANNLLFRKYLLENPYELYLRDFLISGNVLILFAFVGLIGFFWICYSFVKSTKLSITKYWNFVLENKVSIMMLLVLIYTSYSYFGIPLRHMRYLFLNLLPLTYFGYKGLVIVSTFIKSFGFDFRKVFYGLFIVIIFISFSWSVHDLSQPSVFSEQKQSYEGIKEDISQLGLEDCQILSNGWVNLNYVGLNSYASPREFQLSQKINEGYLILLIPSIGEPDYARDEELISSLPLIKETEHYVLLGQESLCKEKYVYDSSYVEEIKNIVLAQGGEPINNNPCFLLFRSFSFAEKTCNAINLNGFILDENRKVG